MRIGIFFGGASREREISFAGGRTVYDNLNKQLFTPVPIFVDSLNRLILLNWQYIYKGTIRDFYPPERPGESLNSPFRKYIESYNDVTEDDWETMVEKIGTPLKPDQLQGLIDFAFLCLHGNFGEDGSIQGLLKWYHIPYSGSGILPSALGMNKGVQKKWMQAAGFAAKPAFTIDRETWFKENKTTRWFEKSKAEMGLPCVIRPAHQGSSIGVSIIHSDNEEDFDTAVDRAFFTRFITWGDWHHLTPADKIEYIRQLTDIREGIGLPLLINDDTFYTAEQLMSYLNNHFLHHDDGLWLRAIDGESHVLIEGFIAGKEFSCIVVNTDKGPLALPPTEIIKGKEVFDYRSKYLAGLSRKVTPIELPDQQIEAIRQSCVQLFNYFEFNTYARIDGFIEPDGTIYLNDPNTTSGMLPSSFFFHQAAEIGLNPSQFLTFIIHTSIKERIRNESVHAGYQQLLSALDTDIDNADRLSAKKKRIAVILGGYSSERHISVESGRNVFEKLAASDIYDPIPVFLTGHSDAYALYRLPVNLLLKDNADDIAYKIKHFSKHNVVERIREECVDITTKFASPHYVFEPQLLTLDMLKQQVDEVFIALHGRPGEDGTLQQALDALEIPYNGSNPQSSQITIDKYKTLDTLRQHGFITAAQAIVTREDWHLGANTFFEAIEQSFIYPLICKPVDDGCSSAVKKINNTGELASYFEIAFRKEGTPIPEEAAMRLELMPKEEFPAKDRILVESLIDKGAAMHFLEVTGGMLTHRLENGQIQYEVFEPSETLSGKSVLSLEEKFLAGEGQNITPARFSPDPSVQMRISQNVRATLQKAAEILGVEGYCRIDAFVRVFENGAVETIIIEVNSLPGMTPATVIFHQAALNGYKPFDFIDQIMTFATSKPYPDKQI